MLAPNPGLFASLTHHPGSDDRSRQRKRCQSKVTFVRRNTSSRAFVTASFGTVLISRVSRRSSFGCRSLFRAGS